MVKSEMENVMEAKIKGLAVMIGAFAVMRNLLGASEIVALVCKWGDSRGEVQSLMKIQDLTLIGCVWQWLVEDIVLRAKTISRVKTQDL